MVERERIVMQIKLLLNHECGCGNDGRIAFIAPGLPVQPQTYRLQRILRLYVQQWARLNAYALPIDVTHSIELCPVQILFVVYNHRAIILDHKRLCEDSKL